MSAPVLELLKRRKKQIELVEKAAEANTVANRTDAIPPEIADLPKPILERVNHEKLLKQTPYFRCPEWATVPSRGCHLEISKEGGKLKPFLLDRHPFSILGRKKDLVDLLVEHQSISGVHCCLVHRGADDMFFLVDLNSTNGVFVDGNRLKPQKYNKLEYGTAFSLGQSTRCYTLTKQAPPKSSSKVLSVTGPNDRAKKEAVKSTADEQVPVSGRGVEQGEEEEDAVPPTAEEKEKEEEAAADIVVERHLKHILIKHVEANNPVSKNPRNKDEAITRSLGEAVEQAQMLYEMGDELAADFADIATECSECATSKRGGDLGKVKRGTFLPEFDSVAFALAPGQVSPPTETKLGVHLIYRVLDDDAE